VLRRAILDDLEARIIAVTNPWQGTEWHRWAAKR
jgi:hypothetical protein